MKPLITATLAAAIFAAVVVGCGRRRATPAGDYHRYSQVGNAIVHYSWDHGDKLPERLSDLVPNYIAKENISVFYPPEEQARLPSNWRENLQLIDSNSDCVYLGPAGIPREILAYENLDRPSADPNRRLHIVPPGGGLVSLTASELKELLGHSATATLDRLKRNRVVYYEANLHASLNSYRLDFGSYPKGDNSAVTMALRGQNPTQKQYHSSYPQERTERGEDLDPWGKPYWIESDGDTVRIKCTTMNHAACLTVTRGAITPDDRPF